MAYQSVNEIEKFSFEDAQITKIKETEQGITMEVEALIVKPNNSQNANYTESYAATTTIRLVEGKIVSGVKEGYKYYDANDVLKEVVADKPLSKEQINQLIDNCENAYVIGFLQESKEDEKFVYSFGIEINEDESYWLLLEFGKAIFNWEQYLNKVQR